MHIDLNSCFATVEQQANPLIRNKPVAVAAYTTPNGCIVSPSIEAKRHGVKVGMRVREGKLLCRDLIVLEPDPPKYRDVHLKFRDIFRQYAETVVPKSIDEAILDFRGMETYLNRSLKVIGQEIKYQIRREIGEWMSCNVGIGTNRFLAKLAASLHKPDGLDQIDHTNIEDIYKQVTLIDLNGINTRFQARLNMWGIYTPMDLLKVEEPMLRKQVFQSINGYYWYLRIRGWEVDDVEWARKSFGQIYSLGERTKDPKKLAAYLMKLTEKMGRRLRSSGYVAQGIHISCLYSDGTYWHKGMKFKTKLYTTSELFKKVMIVFNHRPENKEISKLSATCFDIIPQDQSQLELFEMPNSKARKVADASDVVNDKYGEFVVTPALMMGMNEKVVDRISFGGVKELEELYAGKS